MVFFCEMVMLVFFNSFNVVKNLKKPDLVAREKPPFYTTTINDEHVEKAEDLDIVMPMYNLLEYSDNYQDST